MLLGLGGLTALLAASFIDLRATVLSVLPTADGATLWRYLTTTGHGAAVQARLVFGLALAALLTLSGVGSGAGSCVDSRVGRGAAAGIAFAAGCIGLLSTFSVLSHGAVMGGWWPLPSDLVHFVAAGVWAGGVLAVVMAPVWERDGREALVAAVKRLSTVGLVAVLTLALTGTLNGLLQVGDPAAFLASGYLVALLVKLALVVVTVAIAAVNRFRLLPRLLAGRDTLSLRAALRLEAVLLVLVLVASSWLSTTAVPHAMDGASSGQLNVLENAERLLEHLLR